MTIRFRFIQMLSCGGNILYLLKAGIQETSIGRKITGKYSSVKLFYDSLSICEGCGSRCESLCSRDSFFRAWEYYSKIQTFGDVPWLEKDLSVDSEELYGPKMPRNKITEKLLRIWSLLLLGYQKKEKKK